jgi:preprotein translocase subunit SecG
VYTFFIVLHILVAILLILSILMQSSKGDALSGTFGSTGASGALFGGRGAVTFLSKVTTILAVSFMVISIIISLISAPRQEMNSIVKEKADARAIPSANLPVPQGVAPEEEPFLPGTE